MNLSIKPINNHYTDQVIDLILTIQQKEFNVPITLNDQPDLLKIEEFYFKDGGHFWGALINEELVGTIALIKFDEKAGAIRKMFVKKEYRGKELKIAQNLVDELISFCRKNGIDVLYLGTVNILKAAIRFYERNEFIEIKKESLPSQFPVMDADNIFYTLNLNK
ncbi:GNAT family N-acetyltransferase [Chryseobacterium sp.]|uniref:GNAT family N-acetyltransferase n=1 Tax=Chryseobacterium sp. TaxID=1871047 RepID=UPI0025C4519B|nr:GNAT family N-acetyltransferase [Chryseobacterium sp.]